MEKMLTLQGLGYSSAVPSVFHSQRGCQECSGVLTVTAPLSRAAWRHLPPWPNPDLMSHEGLEKEQMIMEN